MYLIYLYNLSCGHAHAQTHRWSSDCRTQSTAVLRVAIPPRQRHRTVATRDVCATLQMVTLTVQPAAWEWAWGRTGTALGIIHPSLFTRRREKIETINYPPLGTSIPVNKNCLLSSLTFCIEWIFIFWQLFDRRNIYISVNVIKYNL